MLDVFILDGIEKWNVMEELRIDIGKFYFSSISLALTKYKHLFRSSKQQIGDWWLRFGCNWGRPGSCPDSRAGRNVRGAFPKMQVSNLLPSHTITKSKSSGISKKIAISCYTCYWRWSQWCFNDKRGSNWGWNKWGRRNPSCFSFWLFDRKRSLYLGYTP